jgi:iron complex transport system substrate-binding protein
MNQFRRTFTTRVAQSLGPLALLNSGYSLAQDKRVISVGGSLTEIVYALGAEQTLVAVDTTSLFPTAALKLPRVGYARQLSAEGILALRPTVVLLTSEAGPPAVIAQLKAAGVQLEMTPIEHSFDDLRTKIRTVSKAVDKVAQGKTFELQLEADWARAQGTVKNYRARQSAPRVLFILSHSGSAQVSGEGTAADAFIQFAGGTNAMAGFKGYKPLTAEAVIAAAPTAILVTQQGIDALGGVEKLLTQPGLALTPAGRAKRVVAFEALQLLGFGPRLPQTVQEAAALFYA